jgi:hypothetical protein
VGSAPEKAPRQRGCLARGRLSGRKPRRATLRNPQSALRGGVGVFGSVGEDRRQRR